MKSKQLLLTCLLTALPDSAWSASVAPPQREENGMQAVALASPPVTQLRMGRLNVLLEKSTLRQIRDAIGVGSIAHPEEDDGGDWLCYTVKGGTAPERVWLIGDAAQRLMTIQAAQTAGAPSPACPQLPRTFLPLRFDKDIWLKQASSRLTRVYGAPSLNAGARWAYAYTGKIAPARRSGAADADAERSNRLEADIKDGVIVAAQSGAD
ncbi:hypothetical protein [Janthinobacterium sp.]|uniref:hypothetical protein n=1 Tax=Janthinobacterium sp. TaxID=1871054 RepID=UPI00293D3E79|nr:hypothetical protein [Janthinobacterium sp.]